MPHATTTGARSSAAMRAASRARPIRPAACATAARRPARRTSGRGRTAFTRRPAARAAAASGPGGQARTAGPAEPPRAVDEDALGPAEGAGVGHEEERGRRRHGGG